MSNKERVRKAHALINEPILSFENRLRLSRLLVILLDDKTITPQNLFELKADERFMRMYYPYEDYTPNPISAKSHGHTIASLCTGDVKSTILEAVFHLIKKPHVENTSEIKEEIKTTIRGLILKGRTPEEDKKLISLLQKHSRKTKVTELNYKEVAQRFMKCYYPFPQLTKDQTPSPQAAPKSAEVRPASFRFG